MHLAPTSANFDFPAHAPFSAWTRTRRRERLHAAFRPALVWHFRVNAVTSLAFKTITRRAVITAAPRMPRRRRRRRRRYQSVRNHDGIVSRSDTKGTIKSRARRDSREKIRPSRLWYALNFPRGVWISRRERKSLQDDCVTAKQSVQIASKVRSFVNREDFHRPLVCQWGHRCALGRGWQWLLISQFGDIDLNKSGFCRWRVEAVLSNPGSTFYLFLHPENWKVETSLLLLGNVVG